MTTYKVTATAPTVYQLNSVKSFGYQVKPLGNGAYRFEQEFDSLDEAKEYLKDRANMYWQESNINEQELADMIEDIDKFNILTLDAVTGRIVEIED